MKNLCVLFPTLLIACSGEVKNTEMIDTPEKKTIPVVAINDKLPGRTLKLSDIADVERIVRIETRKDVLIPDYFSPLITDKYIIILDAKKMRQFSSDGKFIRVLSVAGKGPQEYDAITGITINAHKEILYFTHAGDREYMQVIDLNSGKWFEKIKFPSEFLELPEQTLVSKLLLVNDSTLIGVPKITSENPFSIFYMSTSGKFLGSLASQEKFIAGYTNPPVPYCAIISGTIHVANCNLDTLYRIENRQKTPLYRFDVENELKEPLLEGNKKNFMFEGPSFAILNTRHFKFFKGDNGALMISGLKDISQPVHYFIDYKNFKASIISEFYLNYLGFRIEVPYFTLNGNIVLWITGEQFKEKAKNVLKENAAAPEILKRVKELDAQISENDNPILIIGKLK